MGRLDDRVIIVTGGAQGIGKAYVEALAGEGAKIVVADLNAEAAGALVRSLGEDGKDAMAVTVDVSNPDDAERMVSETLARFGRVDGLVNNAAVYQRPGLFRGPFDQIPVDDWDRVMAVNLRGIFLCCRAVISHMKERGSGKIINISSGTVAQGTANFAHYSSTVAQGTPNFAHYVTSKAGVIGFTRSVAREMGEYGINVNAIAPGYTLSMDDEDVDDTVRATDQRSINNRALSRSEKPEDLVGTVVFLCSSDSDFITGQTLAVDGGNTMR
jgi:3-oxoacyl-[acyl-carrier protein] reductase